MSEDQKAQPQEVDINNLQLAEEEVDIDVDADPFAFPPPVPDGTHRAKLKGSGKWIAYPKQNDATALGFLATTIEARLIADGQPWDNGVVFDNFVSTMIMPSSGTCRAAGVLKVLGVEVPARTSHAELARLLNDALAGEPIVQIKTLWEGFCGTCLGKKGKAGNVVLRGMGRFPLIKDSEGNPTDRYDHEIECSKDGTLLRTSARIQKYLSDSV